jgi:hypothetical protein
MGDLRDTGCQMANYTGNTIKVAKIEPDEVREQGSEHERSLIMSSEYPEYDEKEGKWFRWETGMGIRVKAYEPMVTTTRGTIPASKVNEVIKKQNEEAERLRQEERNRKTEPEGSCPFKDVSYNSSACESSCAWWNGSGCAFLTGGTVVTGRKCPVSKRECKSDCVMKNNDRCRLIKNKCRFITNSEGE